MIVQYKITNAMPVVLDSTVTINGTEVQSVGIPALSITLEMQDGTQMPLTIAQKVDVALFNQLFPVGTVLYIDQPDPVT